MNILIITSGVLPVPPVNGGAVENLIDFLLKDNEKNHYFNYTVCSIYNKKAIEETKKYKNSKFIFLKNTNIKYKFEMVIRHLINKLPNIYIGNAFINNVKKKIDFNKYDWIIIENSPEYVLPIYENAKGKLILHLHNDRLNVNSKLNYKIFSSYDKIFTLSNYIKNRVKEISPKNSEKVYTLYNGIELDKFGKDKYLNEISFLKRKYNIEEKDKVVLYTGRLVPEKGVMELIKAFNNIKNDNYKLVIVGSMGYGKTIMSKYIKKLVKISSCNKNIIFTGYIDYNMMPAVYAMADIGIVPSIWEEPFALTVIEHLASENPIIVSNSGGIIELVNENCSIIVDKDKNYINNLAKSMKILLSDNEKRNKLKNNTIRQAYKFNIKKYCNRFYILLNK